MSKSYIFPGQGSQTLGMGKDLYDKYPQVKDLFDQSNEILGFNITDIMFGDDEESLKKTKVSQPAIFINSMAIIKVMGDSFNPSMVAGHSLGEFSAITSVGVVSFEVGLKLVKARSEAMQKSCDETDSTMAAVLGLSDNVVMDLCKEMEGEIFVANFNCPGQVVISGETDNVKQAAEVFKSKGAKRVVFLAVNGAFHSPLMQSAKEEMTEIINNSKFKDAICPVYQNVSAVATKDVNIIKKNLIDQIVSSVRWTQTIENMILDGAKTFVEVGNGNVLQGLVKKTNRGVDVKSALA